MEKYQCTKCKKWVEWKDIDVYHFHSVQKSHTLLSIQMCLECRDVIFDFIKKDVSQQGVEADALGWAKIVGEYEQEQCGCCDHLIGRIA